METNPELSATIRGIIEGRIGAAAGEAQEPDAVDVTAAGVTDQSDVRQEAVEEPGAVLPTETKSEALLQAEEQQAELRKSLDPLWIWVQKQLDQPETKTGPEAQQGIQAEPPADHIEDVSDDTRGPVEGTQVATTEADLGDDEKERLARLHEQIQNDEIDINDPELVSDGDYEMLCEVYPDQYGPGVEDASEDDKKASDDTGVDDKEEIEETNKPERFRDKLKRWGSKIVDGGKRFIRNNWHIMAGVAVGAGQVLGLKEVLGPGGAMLSTSLVYGETFALKALVFLQERHRTNALEKGFQRLVAASSQEEAAQIYAELDEKNEIDRMRNRRLSEFASGLFVGSSLANLGSQIANEIGGGHQAQAEPTAQTGPDTGDNRTYPLVGGVDEAAGDHVRPSEVSKGTIEGLPLEHAGDGNLPPKAGPSLPYEDANRGNQPWNEWRSNGPEANPGGITGSPSTGTESLDIAMSKVQPGDGKWDLVERSVSQLSGIDASYPKPQGGEASLKSAVTNLLTKLWDNQDPTGRLFPGESVSLPGRDILQRIITDVQQALQSSGAHEQLTPIQEALTLGSTGGQLTQDQADLIKTTYDIDFASAIR